MLDANHIDHGITEWEKHEAYLHLADLNHPDEVIDMIRQQAHLMSSWLQKPECQAKECAVILEFGEWSVRITVKA